MADELLQTSGSDGVSKSKLEACTATEADVLTGKTFYAGSTDLKTGTLIKGERLLAYYLDWSSGGSFMNVLGTDAIQQLSSGDYGSVSGGNILKFLKSGNYKIYAYASASNDNQDDYVALGSETLVHAHINNQLTQKAIVNRYVNSGTIISVRNGGYAGCTSVVITSTE